MRDLPWVCQSCGHTNMVNFDRLVRWSVTKTVYAEGFICSECQKRQPICHTTLLLDNMLSKLQRINSMTDTYRYHLSKAIARAERLNRENHNGAC